MHLMRYLVGVFFIFSGTVKAIDPIGTGIKMEEYFTVFSEYLPSLEGLFHLFSEGAVLISIIMIILEMIIGISLLLGTFPTTTLILYIIIIVFFTFLTGFTVVTNKVTDCGCFGDFMKLKPIQTFSKDLLLTALIALIWAYRKRFKDFVQNEHIVFLVLANLVFIALAFYTSYGMTGKLVIIGIGLLSSLFYAWVHRYHMNFNVRYGILALFSIFSIYFTMRNYYDLPIIDFRAYKAGTDLRKCTSNEGLDPGEIIIKFKMKNPQSGETRIVETAQYVELKSAGWEFVEQERNVIREPQLPPCKDFLVYNENGEEVQEDLLYDEGTQLWINAYDISKSSKDGFAKVNALVKAAKAKGINVIGLTSSSIENANKLAQGDYVFYNLDAVPIKTMNRANPGVTLIKNGVVLHKWHYNHLPDYSEMQQTYQLP